MWSLYNRSTTLCAAWDGSQTEPTTRTHVNEVALARSLLAQATGDTDMAFEPADSSRPNGHGVQRTSWLEAIKPAMHGGRSAARRVAEFSTRLGESWFSEFGDLAAEAIPRKRV